MLSFRFQRCLRDVTIIVLFVPAVVNAAVFDAATFKTSPTSPGPNEEVTVNITSYAIPLNVSLITWYADKETLASGVGVNSVSLRTKDLGQSTTLRVLIVAPDGAQHEKRYVLTPAVVDILWEADTYTPPFYKGKALPTYSSRVKVVAVPNFGPTINKTGAFSHTFTSGTKGVPTEAGGNSALLSMKYAGSNSPIAVTVTDTRSGAIASGKDNVPTVEPAILFYEDAPLLGIRSERALRGSIATKGVTFKVRAVPYYFSNDDIVNGSLSYNWHNGGSAIAAGIDPNILVVGKGGRDAQSSEVTLSVQNTRRILQKASADLVINFSAE